MDCISDYGHLILLLVILTKTKSHDRIDKKESITLNFKTTSKLDMNPCAVFHLNDFIYCKD